MTGETFFQLHYHLTDTEGLFDLAQGIAVQRRRLKKHDARCRSFRWFSRRLLWQGAVLLALGAVLLWLTASLALGRCACSPGAPAGSAGSSFWPKITQKKENTPMNLGAFMDPEYPIFSTTLCYLERDDAYLMLHRIKKQDDYNHDKWVGVGGKFERFESPEDCLVREVREETGLTLTRWRCRGLLTFVWGNMTEFIHLYTADGWQGEMVQGDACKEGVLEWVPKEKVTELPIWEGDKIFFRLLNGDRPYFSLKLVYDGDTLKQAVLDGKQIVGKT